MARLTLCADDYGLHKGVNTAIIALVRAGRLNAVSCMAVGSAFEAEPLLEAICAAPHRVELGLHLTLTEYSPLGPMPKLAGRGHFPSVGSLLTRSHLRSLDTTEIGIELKRQLDAFERAFARMPDFVDGHQHIHIFPGIRTELTQILRTHARADEPWSGWVRSCNAPTADLLRLRSPRAILLAAMARSQQSALNDASLQFNERFYGVNSFDPRHSFRSAMQGWLAMAAHGSSHALIMCHPGEAVAFPGDPIAVRRADEFQYLGSSEFLDDLAAQALSIA